MLTLLELIKDIKDPAESATHEKPNIYIFLSDICLKAVDIRGYMNFDEKIINAEKWKSATTCKGWHKDDTGTGFRTLPCRCSVTDLPP